MISGKHTRSVMDEVKSALQEALDNAEKIGYLKAQNGMLKFIVELHKQGKISNEIAEMFSLELSLTLNVDDV
jgi:hypothetical protein